MAGNFAERFVLLTGHRPFPWQASLYERLVEGEIPSSCDVPSGLGKSSVIAIWLLARSLRAPLPRRLVYVLDRRTVVDQTTDEVEFLRSNLRRAGLPGDLAVSTLHGRFADQQAWTFDPSRPAVLCGTVDGIGSRLLFGGYRLGLQSRPAHAGLLGQDTLLVHHEAHLESPFQKLLEAIVREQKGRDPWPLRVLALTSSLRSGAGHGLSEADRRDPIARGRLEAAKQLTLHLHGDGELVDRIVERALAFRRSGRAVLIFLRSVDEVMAAAEQLGRAGCHARTLSETMRGYERDRLLDEDEVIRRFLPVGARGPGSGHGKTVYLVSTSAGEFGVNLSADHLVCDLATFDAMARRFGRVNRFGIRGDTQIHVFRPATSAMDRDDPIDRRRIAALELLTKLEGRASPEALDRLDADQRRAASAPQPRVLEATDVLFDAWSMTTLGRRIPGRPPLDPYLHGVAEWEPPTCHVAWRDDVDLVAGDLLDRHPPRELLDDHPLQPHELLSDRTSRVLDTLGQILKRMDRPGARTIWIVRENGEVDAPIRLAALLAADRGATEQSLRGCTLLLPPSLCVPIGGLLSAIAVPGASKSCGDVADLPIDGSGVSRRIRVRGDGPPPPGMRLVRALALPDPLNVGEGPAGVDDSVRPPANWFWFEASRSTDGAGSRTTTEAVRLDVHLAAVEREASRIVQALHLDADLARAVVAAAALHDRGKNRRVWQGGIGNLDSAVLLARSEGSKMPLDATRFRHELGSLLDIHAQGLLSDLAPGLRELALHLVAAHHGRARPHFPAEELFDPDPTTLDLGEVGAQIIERFSWLQRRFGRWGLAFLESILRAADHAATAGLPQESP